MSEVKKQSTIKDMLLATIEEHIDAQNAKGLKKYGETLDDCSVDGYSWSNMVIEELIDALQYQQKEIGRLSHLLALSQNEAKTYAAIADRYQKGLS